MGKSKTKKKHHSRPHNHNVLKEMNIVAAETRMAYSTAYTIANSIALWAVMNTEGYKQQRLLKLQNEVIELENKYWNEEVTLEQLTQPVKEKAKWEEFTWVEYTEDDIKYRKNSYDYVLDKVQLAPQNHINKQYIITNACLLNVLISYGFGETRLNRVADKMAEVMKTYQHEHNIIHRIRQELVDEGGIFIEDPKDPMNNRYLRSVLL